MKKFAIALAVVSLMALGAMAFAHGPGSGWGGGNMGYGYGGGHMMGYGNGGQMGQGGPNYDQKFLDETAELRKDMHELKFEYFEARRNSETPPETLKKLESEIEDLRTKIHEKFPKTAAGNFGGRGCW